MARKETNYIFALASVILLLCCIEVSGKPALNEENRNLCESEPDKAECIREVEEAKGTEQVDGDHQQGDSLVNCDIVKNPTEEMTDILWRNT
ncbi:hypothetical protein ABFA07_001327 [Porites harrisoni]